MQNIGRRALVAASLALTALVSACTPTIQPKGPAVFFPPSPALPRIQYLTFFTGQKDIETQSSFNRFVVGERVNRVVDKPYGVAMHDGKIYVCDTNTTVAVFDLRNRTFSYMKGAVGPGLLRQPVNISTTPDGMKYVSDPVRGQVVEFDAGDNYVRAYGSPGDWKPVDAVVSGDRLYAADMEHGKVVVFDRKTGQTLTEFGNKGDAKGRLLRPSNLAADTAGSIYVTDVARFQVVKFDREGQFQATFGKLGDAPGHFARPKGVAVGRDGLVYAVDAAFNNVQIFTASGRLASSFGGGGSNPGNLTLPAKVAIDYDNVEYFRSFVEPGFKPEYLVLVTSQFGDRRVNIYAYGQQEGKHYPTEEELLKEIEERRAKARGAQVEKK